MTLAALENLQNVNVAMNILDEIPRVFLSLSQLTSVNLQVIH